MTDLATAGYHLRAALSFQLASYAIVLYDHAITFGDEVERIWKQPLTGATALFFLNRYGTPLQFAVTLAAFHSSWPVDVCSHFVRYVGGGTIVMVGICELLMILRVYALCRGNVWILTGLLIVFAAQIALQSAAMSQGIRVPLPPPLAGPCILTGTDEFFAAFWVAPLVTDVSVFLLTVWKTREYFRHQKRFNMPMLELFIRDGVLYFLIIVSANVMNVIVYFCAVEDLKAICASFSQLITSVMISRLILNLRGFRVNQDIDDQPAPILHVRSLRARSRREEDAFARSWAGTKLVGNLGEDLQSPPDESHSLAMIPIRQ